MRGKTGGPKTVLSGFHLWDLSTEGTIRQWAGANLQCVLTEWASLSKTRGLGLELLCPHTVSSRSCHGPDWLSCLFTRLGKGQRTSCSHATHGRPSSGGQASSSPRGPTFRDGSDAEEPEVQAVDRGLTDVSAQPAHWRQSEGNLIPVLDLQETNLQGERHLYRCFSWASGYAA